LGVVFVLIGLPSAVLLRVRAEGWVAALADAAIHGLVWLPLAVTAWAWLSWWGLGAVLATWAATLIVVLRRRSWPSVRRLRRSRADVAIGASWFGVLAVATLLRLREVNFLPWVGDMGAYVNWANEFVRIGELQSKWPPLFPAYLSVSTWAFGPEHTTIGMAATGLVLIVAVGRLLTTLRVDRWLVLAGAAAIAVSVPAVWYSSFPSSESLNAPIFVLWVMLILRVLRAEGGPGLPAVVAVGVTMLALGLLRGSGGLLLAPLAVALVLVLVVRVWRPVALDLWRVFAASTVAALVAYWYGISEIQPYFVDTQLKDLVPGPLFQRVADLGLFDATPRTFAVLAVALTLFAAAGSWTVRRIAAQNPLDRAMTWAPTLLLVGTAAVFSLLIAAQAYRGSEMWAIVGRMGWWPAFGAVVALVAASAIRRPADQVLVLISGLTVLMFVALHASRLAPVTSHAFYLYWDRYLVSEVLPLLVVLTFLGLSLLVRDGARLLELKVRGRDVPAGVVAAFVGAMTLAVVVPPSLPTLRLTTDDVYMRGAYDLTSEIARLVGDPKTPVYWSANANTRVPDFFFPNTWMAFAVPLEVSFGYNVFNVHPDAGRDRERDEVLNAENVALTTACAGGDDFVVLDMDTGGAPLDKRLAGSGAIVKEIGTAKGPVLFLAQPAAPRGWFSVDFSVTGWRVKMPARADQGRAPC
jgi:hypothetical protein